MIKKLFEKIKSIFKKEKQPTVECPYKLEPRKCNDCSNIDIAVNITETKKCSHCGQDLEGKVSLKDENDDYYIWCRSCNYINKLHDNKVIDCPQTGEEVTKAFKLFMRNGNEPSSYSMEENGDKKSF